MVFLSAAPLEVITQNLSSITNGGITGAKAMIGKYNPPSWKPDFYPRLNRQTNQHLKPMRILLDGGRTRGYHYRWWKRHHTGTHCNPKKHLNLTIMSYTDLKQKIDTGEVVLLDGGIGTEILRHGYTWASHQLKNEPKLNLDIHKDYISAGAHVITTNTFQLSRRSFRNHFASDEHMALQGVANLTDRVGELVNDSVQLADEARKALGRDDVLIAASITTLEWCFRPDQNPDVSKIYDEYLEELTDYADAGADIFLF